MEAAGPRLAGRHRRGVAGSGFTLLEVMVVLALIGIISSFALLSLPGRASGADPAEEARALALRVERQLEEAVLLGRSQGLLFTSAGYRVLERLPSEQQGGRWRPLADVPGRRLPEGVGLSLSVDGAAVDLRPGRDVPQLLLLASGEASAFRAVFSRAGMSREVYTLEGDLFGRLRLREGR